jgi:CBS domain-containing protein
MLVEEVMTKNVVSIDCNETVFNACKEYSKHKVGCLVVMDKKIIVGIITERDTIERIILANRDPKTTKVREIMSQNIKTIHSLASLQKAAQIMRENNIKKLPVILNNEIVGIITVTDISRAISAFSKMLDDLTQSYEKNRKTIEDIMEEWGAIINSLKHYRELTKE